jgi:hypothetical protein
MPSLLPMMSHCLVAHKLMCQSHGPLCPPPPPNNTARCTTASPPNATAGNPDASQAKCTKQKERAAVIPHPRSEQQAQSGNQRISGPRPRLKPSKVSQAPQPPLPPIFAEQDWWLEVGRLDLSMVLIDFCPCFWHALFSPQSKSAENGIGTCLRGLL